MIIDDSELCFGALNYEDRLVAFFDILGWRSHIIEAGDDPARIARLAAAVRLFTSQVGTVGDKDARITTFSDNVVFSKLYASEDVPWFLHGVATIMLGAATLGFLVRGGVARGSLIHDDHIVFGPALNRAYELESKLAIYPRVLIDETLSGQLPQESDYITVEGEAFVDPYRPAFWNRVQADYPIKPDVLANFSVLTGVSIPTSPVSLPGHIALSAIATRLSAEMMVVDKPADWTKLAWLFDRIVSRLGGQANSAMIPKSAGLQAAIQAASEIQSQL
jgi:hypothetical protein